MTHFKSVLILSAAATLLSAAPALAQYGSGSGGARASSPVSTLPSTPRSQSTRTASKAVSERSIQKQQKAFEQRQALEEKIARQEAQAKSYGSGTKGVKDAASDTAKDTAQGVKDKAYGSGTDKAKETADKAYGSGDEGVKDAADKAYGSGDEGVKDAADKAYGSGDKGVKDTAHKAYGSDTPASAPAEGTYNSGTTHSTTTSTTSSLPLNCPAGTKAQPDGTCLLVDSRLLGF